MSAVVSNGDIPAGGDKLRRILTFSAAAVGLIVCLALPLIFNNYMMRLATILAMYAALAWSWNFIGGFAGYPSFGIAAFFGLGAYTGAVLLVDHYVTFWMAPIAAALLSAIVAGIIGLPILRLRGHYFAVASLAVAEVFRELAAGWTDVTGGGMGLNLPPLNFSLGGDVAVSYYSMLAVSVLAGIATLLVARSRFGVALRCIRQNEAAAAMIGINTTLTKTAAFAISAGFAAATGAAYASWVNYIDPSDVFSIINSVISPVMVLLGGAGTVFGPLIGAGIYFTLEQTVWHNFLQFHAGMLGIIIVGLALFMPDGILDLVRKRRSCGSR
jgi:branched-chain amino acid transport system permease protein